MSIYLRSRGYQSRIYEGSLTRASRRDPRDLLCAFPLPFLTVQIVGFIFGEKASFFGLFWQAWLNSSTENNILKPFKTTGIVPLDRNKILDRFPPKQAEAPSSSATPPQQLENADCRETTRHFDRVAKDKKSAEAKALRQVIHHLAVQNELLHYENEGLVEALKMKKKQNKKSKASDLVKRHFRDWSGAKWHSPRSFQEARTCDRIIKETQHQEELEKAEMKELAHANKLYNEELLQEKRDAAAQKKEERDTRKAQEHKEIDARKAERQRKEEEKDSKKALPLFQKGKRKALQSAASRKKQNCGAVGSGVGESVTVAAPAAPTITDSRGRNIVRPSRCI